MITKKRAASATRFFCLFSGDSGTRSVVRRNDRLGLRLDISGLGQRDSRQRRADQLVDQHAEQNNIAHHHAIRAQRLRHRDGHAQRHAGLRQQRDAQPLLHLRRALHKLRADARARPLAERTREDIRRADEHHGGAAEHVQFQLRAAEHEEQDIQRRRPAVGLIHDLRREIAHVAEHRAQHHAHQQAGEADLHAADLKLHHRKRHCQDDERDGERQPLAVGFEIFLRGGEDAAHHKAQQDGEHDFQQRLNEDARHVVMAVVDRLGHAEADREHDQTHRVIQRDNRQQQVGQFALRLVLTNDHQRRRRGGRRRNRAQHNRVRQGHRIAEHEDMQPDEHQIDHQRRRQRLKNADHRRLLAGVAKLGQAELVADGKGDEAERHVVKQAQRFHVAVRREAQTLYAELAQAVRADQNTRNQVARHSRQLERLDEAGNQQTGAERDRNAEQRFHNDYLTFPLFRCTIISLTHAQKQVKKRLTFAVFSVLFYTFFAANPP